MLKFEFLRETKVKSKGGLIEVLKWYKCYNKGDMSKDVRIEPEVMGSTSKFRFRKVTGRESAMLLLLVSQ